ncbi:hypothetical protein [Streptomyces sp. NPDC058751]|uniref:hypothetical protein n=1 Tax=Streptomyces sp. NPDC058751 TaxID=3346623 RepID=UPI00369C03CE
MSNEQNLAAWTAYGRHHIDRGTEIPDADRIDWGFWPNGPGAEVLGDLSGKRVLDIGAVVHAVESSVTQHERAGARHADVPGLRLIHADAVEYLKDAEPYDVIYSIQRCGRTFSSNTDSWWTGSTSSTRPRTATRSHAGSTESVGVPTRADFPCLRPAQGRV